jgi:hypothetical protein
MTYIEILEKIQAQAIINLKQIQAGQISTLQTVREVVASLPSMMSSPNVPTMEGIPTLSQVVELATSFSTELLDQEKAFVSQLTEVFSPAVKSAITV